jgi:hypothetical protein
MQNPVVEFNNTLDDFFNYILKVMPVDTEEENNIRKDIVAYHGLVNGSLKMNKMYILEGYIVYVLEHENQINNRDEKFFIDMDLNNKSNNENTLLELMKFRKCWHKFSDQIKEKIFDYVIVMTYWARQYFNMKCVNIK